MININSATRFYKLNAFSLVINFAARNIINSWNKQLARCRMRNVLIEIIIYFLTLLWVLHYRQLLLPRIMMQVCPPALDNPFLFDDIYLALSLIILYLLLAISVLGLIESDHHRCPQWNYLCTFSYFSISPNNWTFLSQLLYVDSTWILARKKAWNWKTFWQTQALYLP